MFPQSSKNTFIFSSRVINLMKKGFLTIDVIVSLGLLVLSFMFLVRYVNFLWNVDDFLAGSLPVSSAVMGLGSSINSIYALTPLSYGSPVIISKAYGTVLCFVPRNESAGTSSLVCKNPSNQMWLISQTTWNEVPGNTIYSESSDLEFFVNITNKTFTNLQKRIGFVSESPGSLNQHNMSIVYDDKKQYSYLSFGKYESGNIVVESYSGSYSRSSLTPENISVITCSEFLDLLNSTGFSYGALSVYPGAPWNCHDSCQGVSDTPCVYSCRTSGCDSKCSAAGIDISLFNIINSSLGASSGLECKIFGPYWNETNVINDTCGGFPPYPNCGSVPYTHLYEAFWVKYGFRLDAVPAGDIFVNAIARNGVIVAVNGRIVSCTASSLYSEVHSSIRKYLMPNAYNEILIAFLRTDSICGPCVGVRPAYGVGGMWKISCSPVSIDPGYYGWMGCSEYLTVKCESTEFSIGAFSVNDSTKPEITFSPESGSDLTEVTVRIWAEDPYPGTGVASFGYRKQNDPTCPSDLSLYKSEPGKTSTEVTLTMPGTWYICAYAKDGAGNVAIERGGPYTISTVYVNIDPINDYVNSLNEITGNSSGKPYVIEVRLLINDTTDGKYWDGTTWTTSEPDPWPLVNTTDNYTHWFYREVPSWVHNHTYYIHALARSVTEGNVTVFEHFTYDIVPPAYISYTPDSSQWYNSAVTVRLTGHDDVSGIEMVYYTVVSPTTPCPDCDPDASGYTEGDTFVLSTEGYHKVCMCAIDKAGNMMVSPNSTVYKIDTTPPTVTIVDVEDNSTPGILNGTAADSLSGIKYVRLLIYDKNTSQYWDGTTWGSNLVELDTSYSSGKWSYDASGVQWVENHTYVLTARAYDKANNLKTASDSFIK